MTNFGSREELIVNGVPVGRTLGPAPDGGRRPEARPARASGSWSPTRRSTAPRCARLARRVGLGLARAGSVAHHGSGEIFMAFGTGMRLDRDGKPDGTPVVDRPRARPALRGGRRGVRGGGAELDVHRPDRDRSRRQHQRDRRTRRRVLT